MKVRNVEDKNSPQVLFKSQLCWKHLSAEGTSKECAGSRYGIVERGELQDMKWVELRASFKASRIGLSMVA